MPCIHGRFLQEWLYLSTNLSSSEDDLNEISLKVSSFSRHAFRDRSKKNLNWASISWLTFCLPDQGLFLLVLVDDFVRGWLSWTLSLWVRRLWKLPAQHENLWICPGLSDGTFFGHSVHSLQWNDYVYCPGPVSPACSTSVFHHYTDFCPHWWNAGRWLTENLEGRIFA